MFKSLSFLQSSISGQNSRTSFHTGSAASHPHPEQGNAGVAVHRSVVTALNVPRFVQAMKTPSLLMGLSNGEGIDRSTTKRSLRNL